MFYKSCLSSKPQTVQDIILRSTEKYGEQKDYFYDLYLFKVY